METFSANTYETVRPDVETESGKFLAHWQQEGREHISGLPTRNEINVSQISTRHWTPTVVNAGHGFSSNQCRGETSYWPSCTFSNTDYRQRFPEQRLEEQNESKNREESEQGYKIGTDFRNMSSLQKIDKSTKDGRGSEPIGGKLFFDEPRIKRPMNCFMLWSRQMRTKMAKKEPKKSNGEVSKVLGDLWKKMSKSEKMPFIEKAEKIRQEHLALYPNYKYRPVRKRKTVSDQCCNLMQLPEKSNKETTPNLLDTDACGVPTSSTVEKINEETSTNNSNLQSDSQIEDESDGSGLGDKGIGDPFLTSGNWLSDSVQLLDY